MKHSLTPEEAAHEGHLPFALLKRHWRVLEADRLVYTETFFKKSTRLVDRDKLGELYERLFWILYEEQSIDSKAPPWMRQGVVRRVFNEIRHPDQTILHIAELTKMPVGTLDCWIDKNPRAVTVARFEQFVMEYKGVSLFDLIDVGQDIQLTRK